MGLSIMSDQQERYSGGSGLAAVGILAASRALRRVIGIGSLACLVAGVVVFVVTG